jgi:ATP-dependent Lon protease
LKQKKHPGGSHEPGNKVEIDAVLAKAGSQEFWEYLMKSIEKEYPRRDYTRVIYNYRDAPIPHVVGFPIPAIVGLVQTQIRNIADEITKEVRNKMHEQLKEQEGFLIVQDKENEIRKELGDIVNNDQQINDISEVLSETSKSIEEEITKTIMSRLEKLDREKGYGLMDKLGIEGDKRVKV